MFPFWSWWRPWRNPAGINSSGFKRFHATNSIKLELENSQIWRPVHYGEEHGSFCGVGICCHEFDSACLPGFCAAVHKSIWTLIAWVWRCRERRNVLETHGGWNKSSTVFNEELKMLHQCRAHSSYNRDLQVNHLRRTHVPGCVD